MWSVRIEQGDSTHHSARGGVAGHPSVGVSHARVPLARSGLCHASRGTDAFQGSEIKASSSTKTSVKMPGQLPESHARARSARPVPRERSRSLDLRETRNTNHVMASITSVFNVSAVALNSPTKGSRKLKSVTLPSQSSAIIPAARSGNPCNRGRAVITCAKREESGNDKNKLELEHVNTNVTTTTRRTVGLGAGAFTFAIANDLLNPSNANATPPRATFQVAESDFKPLPGTKPPIMYADIKGGGGTEGGAKDGSRVAVHFDVKFRRITIATSRQGAGVTGGTPYGFTVGVPAGTPGGPFIKCLNEGIKGMGPGQFRRLVVPPEYAYGANQVQEIPPNATLTVDIELLSIAARA